MGKKNAALKALPRHEPESSYRSSLWSIRLPASSSPLEDVDEVRIQNPIEHAFFLCCCELYRVIELNHRELPRLIETYSRYRTREHFKESLAFRYFDSDLSKLSSFDPDLVASQIGMFNLLHELRSSISFSDALPHTIRTEIEGAFALLTHEWNRFRDEVQDRYGWRFKRIG